MFKEWFPFVHTVLFQAQNTHITPENLVFLNQMLSLSRGRKWRVCVQIFIFVLLPIIFSVVGSLTRDFFPAYFGWDHRDSQWCIWFLTRLQCVFRWNLPFPGIYWHTWSRVSALSWLLYLFPVLLCLWTIEFRFTDDRRYFLPYTYQHTS